MKKNIHSEVNVMSAILCLCVITIHLTATPVTQLMPGSLWHILIFIVNKVLVFSVPGFLFLSGFKLFSQYGQREYDLKQFYAKRLRSVVLPYVICVLLYFVYYYAKHWAAISSIPEFILLGTLASHFYYIVIAVQMYLLFPLLKKAVNRFPLITAGLSFLSTLTFYAYVHFTHSDRFAGTYLFFFVMGMLFRKYDLVEHCIRHFKVILALYLLFSVPHFTALYRSFYGYGGYYSLANAATVIYDGIAICFIFALCTIACRKWEFAVRITQPLSRVSYFVYLYHMLPIIILQYDLFPRFPLTPRQQFLISCVVIYGMVFLYAVLDNRLREKATP